MQLGKKTSRNLRALSTRCLGNSSILIAAQSQSQVAGRQPTRPSLALKTDDRGLTTIRMETALTSALGATAQKITAEEFDALVRRHQQRVYRFLLMLLRDPEEADNLTQECFLRAYQNLSSFRGESTMETWLLRIASNLAHDHARNRKASFWKRLLGLDDGG